MKSLLLLILVLAVCWASKPINTDFYDEPPKNVQEENDYKLPDDVIPTEYKIELTPKFEVSPNENFTFNGKSTIKLEIVKNTYTITFHAKELDLNETTIVFKPEAKEVKLKPKLSYNVKKDFAILTFDELLQIGTKGTLTLDYTGKLNDDLRGFYRSSYQDEKRNTKWLATTHFEPVGARRAFPCWDEPHIKTPFTIIITVPDKSYKAISNMKIDEKKTSLDGKTFTFEKTPAMPTYLVAFVVSDFTSKEKEEDTRLKVWAKPTVLDDAKNFALEYGLKTLDELSVYTNYNYYEKMKMQKMDQIAIPDFAAGAMENWGLVTYR